MKPTVLLVEDEQVLRELLCEALEDAGYRVVAAREGQEALDALPGIEHVCLILLDLLMPGMNGWDFFAAVKERPEMRDVPVIIHSSAPNQAPAGATRVLQKPMRLEVLLSIVEQYCSP